MSKNTILWLLSFIVYTSVIDLSASQDMTREKALKILTLSQGATQDDVNKAYRRLSLVYHPDRLVKKTEIEKCEAEATMKLINAAKEFLTPTFAPVKSAASIAEQKEKDFKSLEIDQSLMQVLQGEKRYEAIVGAYSKKRDYLKDQLQQRHIDEIGYQESMNLCDEAFQRLTAASSAAPAAYDDAADFAASFGKKRQERTSTKPRPAASADDTPSQIPNMWEQVKSQRDLFNYIVNNKKERNKISQKMLDSIPVQDEDNISALHLAVQKNDLEALNFLLSKGADASVVNDDGNTPLIQAIEDNNVEAMRLLYTYLPPHTQEYLDYKAKIESGTTMLDMDDVYKQYIKPGKDRYWDRDGLGVGNTGGLNAIALAAEKAAESGDLKMLKELLALESNICGFDNYGKPKHRLDINSYVPAYRQTPVVSGLVNKMGAEGYPYLSGVLDEIFSNKPRFNLGESNPLVVVLEKGSGEEKLKKFKRVMDYLDTLFPEERLTILNYPASRAPHQTPLGFAIESKNSEIIRELFSKGARSINVAMYSRIAKAVQENNATQYRDDFGLDLSNLTDTNGNKYLQFAGFTSTGTAPRPTDQPAATSPASQRHSSASDNPVPTPGAASGRPNQLPRTGSVPNKKQYLNLTRDQSKNFVLPETLHRQYMSKKEKKNGTEPRWALNDDLENKKHSKLDLEAAELNGFSVPKELKASPERQPKAGARYISFHGDIAETLEEKTRRLAVAAAATQRNAALRGYHNPTRIRKDT